MTGENHYPGFNVGQRSSGDKRRSRRGSLFECSQSKLCKPPLMNLLGIHADEALRLLGSSHAGLVPEEALRRRREYGPNLVERVRDKPLRRRLAENFTGFSRCCCGSRPVSLSPQSSGSPATRPIAQLNAVRVQRC
jgi:hypothetical protein